MDVTHNCNGGLSVGIEEYNDTSVNTVCTGALVVKPGYVELSKTNAISLFHCWLLRAKGSGHMSPSYASMQEAPSQLPNF